MHLLQVGTGNPPSAGSALYRAAIAIFLIQDIALTVIIGALVIQYRTAERRREDASRGKYADVVRYINTSVDPCANFYDYVCGNWEVVHPNAEDVFDLAEKMVVDVAVEWLKTTPVPPGKQTRSTAKVWSAIYLCHSVYSSNAEHLSIAKERLSRMGLKTTEDIPPDTSLVDLLVGLSLRYHLPVTVTIVPKYDLRSTRRKRSSMVLTVYFGSPIITSWFRVSNAGYRIRLAR